jgi:iron(III) transport system substrate-binding protein|tara:strand:- start:2961 stop:3977 length:1017 start_codon:yes stop_codon:yes gene_type:complete
MLKPTTLIFALMFSLSSVITSASEVNIYSARKEMLIKPLLDQFTQATDIKVNLVTGKADALLARLLNEGKLTPADVFLTTDAGRLYRAKQAGMLQSIDSSYLKQHIPAYLRDIDSQWFGLSTRARPIMYSTERVKPESLSTYEALAQPEFKGKVCIRSSSNIYNQSLVASMLAADEPAKTSQFLQDFVKNFAQPPKGGDRDQIKAIANGICDVAIANTYYLAGMINGNNKDQQEAAAKVSVFWPNQAGRGTHVNISGAGIIKSSKNREAAVKLLEFLASAEAQSWYAQTNNEYPVRQGVAYSPLLESWGTFKADQINLSRLGELNAQAVKLMDKAGWR